MFDKIMNAELAFPAFMTEVRAFPLFLASFTLCPFFIIVTWSVCHDRGTYVFSIHQRKRKLHFVISVAVSFSRMIILNITLITVITTIVTTTTLPTHSTPRTSSQDCFSATPAYAWGLGTGTLANSRNTLSSGERDCVCVWLCICVLD